MGRRSNWPLSKTTKDVRKLKWARGSPGGSAAAYNRLYFILRRYRGVEDYAKKRGSK